MDKRIAGIIMWLPCIDGAWDKQAWGSSLWDAVQRDRFRQSTPDTPQTIQFWPLTDDEAAGKGNSVLSGEYVRQWSSVAQSMTVSPSSGGKPSFTGKLTLSSFWDDFNTRPLDYFDKIAPAPLLWVMATEDVVCGPLEVTRGEYEKLLGPKEICVLEGEHLPQYFGGGFSKSVEAMLGFMEKHAK